MATRVISKKTFAIILICSGVILTIWSIIKYANQSKWDIQIENYSGIITEQSEKLNHFESNVNQYNDILMTKWLYDFYPQDLRRDRIIDSAKYILSSYYINNIITLYDKRLPPRLLAKIMNKNEKQLKDELKAALRSRYNKEDSIRWNTLSKQQLISELDYVYSTDRPTDHDIKVWNAYSPTDYAKFIFDLETRLRVNIGDYKNQIGMLKEQRRKMRNWAVYLQIIGLILTTVGGFMKK